MQKTYIGQGCSRKVYLLETGDVIKEPKYGSHKNFWGSPNRQVLADFIKEFKNDSSIAKIIEYQNLDFKIYPSSLGTLAEYLVTLKLKKLNMNLGTFALCKKIIIRKRRNMQEISIVGIYENAYQKALTTNEYFDMDIFEDKKLGFSIDDLHDDNIADDRIIMDYGNLKGAW